MIGPERNNPRGTIDMARGRGRQPTLLVV